MQHLSTEERSLLCTQADFLHILANDGITAVASGDHFTCSLRAERTPSCHVWPPNSGKNGTQGWTWYDFGAGEGGDTLHYLISFRNMDFLSAVRLLTTQSNYIPSHQDTSPHISISPLQNAACSMHTQPRMPMSWARQKKASIQFYAMIDRLDPSAQERGHEYLRSRGINHYHGLTYVRHLTGGRFCRYLTEQLYREDATLYIEAGLIKNAETPQPLWRNECVLMACLDRHAQAPVYTIGRHINNPIKYLNQSTAHGAQRIPFGLPALAAIQSNSGIFDCDHTNKNTLYIVEGAIDALAAHALHMHAIATLSRPSSGSFIHLGDHFLAQLQQCHHIIIIPDNDTSSRERELSTRKANELAHYLNKNDCNADVHTLELLDLGHYKDLGEVVENRKA